MLSALPVIHINFCVLVFFVGTLLGNYLATFANVLLLIVDSRFFFR